MGLITVTPVTIEPNTRSSDLVGVGQTVLTTDTFTIPVKGNTRTIQLFMEELGAGAAVVHFNAGDNPPSFLAGLDDGGLDINLATSDLREIRFQPGQFIQDDQSGSITGVVTGQSVKLYALRESNAE